MDQSLEMFPDSFHSFYIFGIQKCKINVFGEKIFLGAFLFKKNTKHLKFDLPQIFLRIFKK